MRNTITSLILGAALLLPSAIQASKPSLTFDPSTGVKKSLTMPDGQKVNYTAYEKIYYVTNVEDTAYQYLNFYFPDGAKNYAPILLRTYIGGYMAAHASEPNANDATGRALLEGYAVCIPGSRGSNSVVDEKKYTGRIPNGLLDLKAAVRYLRYNDAVMPGNAERIITDGTSAGGAMSALVGTTGNYPDYEPYLKKMGAAVARDNVFASICYCPITDLEHADMAYEWLYGSTNTGMRGLSSEQQQVSKELAEQFPSYINSLNLKKADGTTITADNYLEYMKSFLIKSLQRAQDEGCEIPDTIGIVRAESGLRALHFMGPGPQMRKGPADKGDKGQTDKGPIMGRGYGRMPKPTSEFIIGLDMNKYLNYVVSTQALKTPPAFDAQGVLGADATAENNAFGDEKGNAANFTEYSLHKTNPNAKLTEEMKKRVKLINPMNFVGNSQATNAAYWYIRHGAHDRDTSFPISINLATKLMNNGASVDFALPWNRPHSGDYNLNDLFKWLNEITTK